MRWNLLLWLTVIVGTLGGGTPGWAEDVVPQSEVDQMFTRLQAQEARIAQLEQQLYQSQQTQAMPVGQQQATSLDRRLQALESAYRKAEAAEKKEERAEEPEWEDVSAQKWEIKVGGRVHGDYVMYANQDAANLAAVGDAENYFEFRRLRLRVEGEGYGVYDFRVELDFEPENAFDVLNDDADPETILAEAVSLKDVYVGIKEIPLLGYVRFGNFKEPFSLEELTSSNYITFIERSLPHELWVPSRRVGIAASDYTDAEDFTWAYGAFFDDISQEAKERVDDNQGINVAMRGTWNPYYADDGRHLLHLGSAFIFTEDQDDVVRFRNRPEVHEGVRFIDTGNLAVSDYYRYGTEAALVWGSASLQSELYYTTTNGIAGVPDQEFYGGYVFGSYFLTGEHRNYRRTAGAFDRVTPLTNFWVVDSGNAVDVGWGAWEFVARWSMTDLDDPFLAGRGAAGKLHNVTSGFNWYWNPYTRYMFNWIHAMGDRNDVGDNDADILAMRLQVDF